MYIYHALINALSVHMIHINLNTIFCTHVEHSPTKTIYIKYYTKKQTHTLRFHFPLIGDCSSSLNATALLQFTYQVGDDIQYSDDGQLIAPLPNLTVFRGNDSARVNITGENAGHVTLGLNSTSSEFEE